MIKEKRLVTQNTVEQLADNIIVYAENNGMTIKNIRNSVALVEKHMKNNAILEKRDPEEAESP